ncbi:MAG: ABC transporter substrate-binding protein [Clostridia bacterium]
MKANAFRIIFFTIVIVLIILAVYIVYRDKKTEKIVTNAKKTDIKVDKEINIGICNFDKINPVLTQNKDVQYIDKLIFNSLVNVSKDFKIESDLAQEISKINDKTYIIKIKENVVWHDGTSFTTEDIAFTIEGLKSKNTLYKQNVEKIIKTEIIDKNTIKIFLEEPVSFFEYMLNFPILANHAYNKQTLEPTTNIPIGTGDYKVVKINENEIQLEKSNTNLNEKIDIINIKLCKDVKEVYSKFSKQELDLILTQNIYYEDYIGTIGFNTEVSKGREFDYLAINNEKKLLQNKEIRKAIYYAIDKKEIIYNVYNNKYIATDFPLDYGCYLYQNGENQDDYNLNNAKGILTEAGWTYRNNSWIKQNSKLEFNLIVNNENQKRVMVAESIKKQLEKIGIKINIVKVNNNGFKNYLKNKNYDIILTGNIIPIYPDLTSYFGEGNLSNYNNQEINEILKEINSIESEELLKQKYNRIYEIYKEEIPFISLYNNSNFLLHKKALKGDLSNNWYNIFYNIENWYKIKEN